MIQERKVPYSEMQKNARELRKQGYVSAKGMHASPETRTLTLPRPAELRKIARTSESLSCIKCNVGGTISYWYKLSDLEAVSKTHSQNAW